MFISDVDFDLDQSSLHSFLLGVVLYALNHLFCIENLKWNSLQQPALYTHAHTHTNNTAGQSLGGSFWHYVCDSKSYQNCMTDASICFVSSADVLQWIFYKVFWWKSYHVSFLEPSHSSGYPEWSHWLKTVHERERFRTRGQEIKDFKVSLKKIIAFVS